MSKILRKVSVNMARELMLVHLEQGKEAGAINEALNCFYELGIEILSGLIFNHYKLGHDVQKEIRNTSLLIEDRINEMINDPLLIEKIKV